MHNVVEKEQGSTVIDLPLNLIHVHVHIGDRQILLMLQSIAKEAMTQFTAVLNSETNETMIVHLVTELSKWVKLSPSSIPAELVERLKVGAKF